MEFLSSTTGRNMKMNQNMSGSRVRPSVPVVSASTFLEDIKPEKLIENNPTGGDSEEILQYLLDKLASRVHDVVIDSPLQRATKLSQELGVNFFIKREDTQPYGAEVLEGNTFDDDQQYAGRFSPDTYIPVVDHPDVINGQEINHELKDIHSVFIPVGSRGIVGRPYRYFKILDPNTKFIGVEPFGASSMSREGINLEQVDHIADGVTVAHVPEEAFRLNKNLIDAVMSFGGDNDMYAALMPKILEDVSDEEGRNKLETADALAIAGAVAYCKHYNIKDENIVVIASGANMDFSKLKLTVDLEDIGGQREAMLATLMPEEPGSFKKFCEHVGSLNITQFRYRFNSGRKQALVLYSVDVPEKLDLEAMLDRMKSSEMKTVTLSNYDLVKQHLKHLMGDISDHGNEIFCQFNLPETPGALRMLLDAFSPRWNITLLHYREQGGLDERVLVGFQVPKSEEEEFQNQAYNLAYSYEIESLNEAYRLLLE